MTPPLPPLVEAALAAVRILEELGIPYVVAGSMASSAHGEARTTQDADLVVDLPADLVAPLIERLRAEFYADSERARQAVQRAGSFNVVHLPTMSKIDLFVAGEGAADRAQMERRQRLPLPGMPQVTLSLASAEDVVVQKLRWFRLGNEVSERQWRDALSVVRVQAEALDRDYLRRMTRELGIEDLLDRLLEES